MPRRKSGGGRVAHLLDSASFERVLRSPSQARTTHFAMHHLPALAVAPSEAAGGTIRRELSTIATENSARAVDDSQTPVREMQLGVVVPKRHARRAVTRSLLKRQIYAAGDRHVAFLTCGVWVVRLRAPFDRSAFPSAASKAMRDATAAELELLFRAASAKPAS